MPDQRLIEQMANGDANAFAQFYDRHSPRILGFLLRMVGDRQHAEDVLQEVFWQVWCRAPQYSPSRGNPLVWLLLIARSRAIDHQRKQRRAPQGSMETEPRSVEDAALLSSMKESAEVVRGALAELPSEQQSAIRLSFFAGLSHAEIAKVQEVPLGTAKTRIRSGVRRLRELLDRTKEVRVP
ncbi:MAG: sigma-70 family RNA polymerase sigma factor [Planctomycetota bacterium]